MKPKILLCLALVLSGVLPGCSTITQQAPATAKPSQMQKQVETLPDLKTVLKDIESSVPELALVQITEAKDDTREWKGQVTGYYVPANQRALTLEPGRPADLFVTIEFYDSADAAKRGIEWDLRTTSVSPDQRELFKGLTIYRWSSYGPDRVLCRVGLYVVNVCAVKPSAQAFVMKALDVLVQDLRSSVKG